jgi:hypothetical protein
MSAIIRALVAQYKWTGTLKAGPGSLTELLQGSAWQVSSIQPPNGRDDCVKDRGARLAACSTVLPPQESQRGEYQIGLP